MSSNLLYADFRCPHCGHTGETEIEVDIDGQGRARDYHLGDLVDWLSGRRPVGGMSSSQGYVECEVCHRDYFVRVSIVSDKVESVVLDPSRQGYISNPTPQRP